VIVLWVFWDIVEFFRIYHRRDLIMYTLAELLIFAVVAVAISITLFLISLTVLGLGKGVVALVGLIRKVVPRVVITVASFVQAYRSGIGVWASGRRARGLVLRPSPGPVIAGAPGESMDGPRLT